MSLPYYQTLLSEPLAFWAASCNEQACPELVRVNGVDATSFPELTFFIPEVFAKRFIATLNPDAQLALLGTHIPTYNSFQYKGAFHSIRPCAEKEVQQQFDYVHKLTDIVDQLLGLSKQEVFDSIFFQPSYAVHLIVTDVFNQTPGKGAGQSEILKPIRQHD